ncbi:hypothetical protein C6988_00360 [Nitrosopumilus sp. b1]|uniref:hypothetical protein n=1 Tax=Nitrosopumilus sp. b1 TaxID=2109907 RepID=UPI0015F3EC42|nr:hypothetical protein [Nitrosopumilus sp. b1]KAF6244074.1 hypothetical protein C6988_00360 [Nitrosopumilus sp. b1]
MTQTCKGLCFRFKESGVVGKLRYKIGQKWCSLCALFFFTQEHMCPCCKTRLRSKPRSKNYEVSRI